MILCKLDSGIDDNVCQFLIGGLKNIYLANYEDVVGATDSDMDNILDTVQFSTSGEGFYKFKIVKNTSSFTQVLTINGANKYVVPTLTFVVAKNDQASFDIAEILALGTFLAIAEKRDGSKVLLGLLNGLEASALEINSGTAEGDSSAISVTLSGSELGFAKEFKGVVPLAA